MCFLVVMLPSKSFSRSSQKWLVYLVIGVYISVDRVFISKFAVFRTVISFVCRLNLKHIIHVLAPFSLLTLKEVARHYIPALTASIKEHCWKWKLQLNWIKSSLPLTLGPLFNVFFCHLRYHSLANLFLSMNRTLRSKLYSLSYILGLPYWNFRYNLPPSHGIISGQAFARNVQQARFNLSVIF